jgi:WD40 repeat protein
LTILTGLLDVGATLAIFKTSVAWFVALGIWVLFRLIVTKQAKGSSYTLPLKTLECTKNYKDQDAIHSLCSDVDNNLLVVGHHKNIKLFYLRTLSHLYTLPEQSNFIISSVVINATGKTLAIAGRDWVTLLDLQTKKVLDPFKGCSYQRLNKIVITEDYQEIFYGEYKQFTVKGLDQNNININIKNKNITWEATGGQIEQGLFKAGQCAGKFEVKVKVDFFEASVPITIIEPPRLAHFSVTPSTVTLEFGQIQQFLAEVLDQRRNPIQVNVLWEVNGGGTIDQNGKFKAESKERKFEVIALASFMRQVIPITIIEPSELTRIQIIPSSVILEPEQKQQFCVIAFNQRDEEISVNNINWKAANSQINKSGSFRTTAFQKGCYQVTATVGHITAQAEVTVPAVLKKLKISPEEVELKPEEECIFTVAGFDQTGEPLEIKSVSWATTTGGSISNQGVFQGDYTKREVTVTAQVGNIRDTAIVTILPVLKKLIISPKYVCLEPEEECIFTVTGFDQTGARLARKNVEWTTTTGGSISNEGVFKGGYKNREIIITAKVGDISDIANVTLIPVVKKIEIHPGVVELKPGEQKQFFVKYFDKLGNEIDLEQLHLLVRHLAQLENKFDPGEVYWETTGGQIDQDGRLTVAHSDKGNFQVTVTVKHLTANAEVNVLAVVRKLKISPEQVELKPEEELTFTITGFDQTGDIIELKNVGWTTTIGGAISRKGVFQGGYTKREVTVTAKIDNISDMAIVTLLPVLRKLEIYPSFVYLKPYEQQTFAVKGFDQFRNEIEPGNVYWETTGGQIEQDGTFTVAQSNQGYLQVNTTSVSTPKHTQNVRAVLLYIGIYSRLISWFISYETLITDVLRLNFTSADNKKQFNNSILDETQFEVNLETTEETNIIVQAEEGLDVKLNESPTANSIVETNILDFQAALEGWLAQKLRKLIARCFQSISCFCLNEATANLSASADVFVLAVEFNPYKYFKCLKVLPGHSESVIFLAITPDGQKLINSSWHEPIQIWNITTGELLNTLEACFVECVAIAPDGQTLVSADWGSTIKIWDLNTSNLLHSIYCADSVVLVAITPDGQKIVSVDTNNVIKVWDLNDQELLKNLGSSLEDYIHPSWWHKRIVITPDGKRIISALKTLTIYDLETGEIVNNLRPKINFTYSLAMTRDGKKLISSHKKQIKIWDLKAKHLKILFSLKSRAKEVYALAVTPDDQRFVSSGCIVDSDLEDEISNYGSVIEIWDINTGEKIHSIEEYHSGNNCVYCLAITPDGKQIITGYRDGSIKIWGIPELDG